MISVMMMTISDTTFGVVSEGESWIWTESESESVCSADAIGGIVGVGAIGGPKRWVGRRGHHHIHHHHHRILI